MHKTNVLTFAGDLWQRTFDEVSAEFPDVVTAYNHVDAACIYLHDQPQRYDVIVTDNLFGDILTDLAGAVAGGIGLAASANLNPDRTGPSLFEPVHGSAHDIAGTGRANPVAAIRSAGMMLEFLGEAGPAARITKAVSDWLAAPIPHSVPSPSATPSQKGSDQCPSPRRSSSGWMASWCRGTRPGSTSSRTPSITGAASSKASAPTRRHRGRACSV